ncbi:endolysin [Gordonia phage SteveFrench]|uniref:Lysin A, protease M23 domain n=2 Tax=Montyvirus stevefrench TaxID=2734258 RepID=A0A890UTU2_9CAUD|nr:endolysin [Gordonia phage SteveFrench]AUV60637.1 lysin A, protease M23 domain [Gordonia phage SteveFrench]QRI45620.1 lysin A, protease M23 domain [Gordonia phage RoyalG]
MTTRYHPLKKGYVVTSPFGWRAFDNAVHQGIDFGASNGTAAGWDVFAIQAGTVLYSGAAIGYGGPDPAGWIVIDSDDSQGSGVFEYGHIVREGWVRPGAKVAAGQKIGRVNGVRATNGGVDPHLHVSYMPYEYNSNKKKDFAPLLREAKYVGDAPAPTPAPVPNQGGTVSHASDVRIQLRGPGDNGWAALAPQPDEKGNRFSIFKGKNVTAQTVVEGLATVIFELTYRLPNAGRGFENYRSRKGDTVLGLAGNAAAIAAENQELLRDIQRKLDAQA